ncbi:hypothetical protein CYMTET_10142 [Cymbomonas tetramitiformis]|uniref:Uncharacterized protein n=1 Tax=Cymbomonas tetramitiformis TaxID=36881 RepID=A0AAE0GQ68_9CHLO|nr:hypothetical protein CYMTET_10142 [Cymbomonas tetramitiformis]
MAVSTLSWTVVSGIVVAVYAAFVFGYRDWNFSWSSFVSLTQQKVSYVFLEIGLVRICVAFVVVGFFVALAIENLVQPLIKIFASKSRKMRRKDERAAQGDGPLENHKELSMIRQRQQALAKERLAAQQEKEKHQRREKVEVLEEKMRIAQGKPKVFKGQAYRLGNDLSAQ